MVGLGLCLAKQGFSLRKVVLSLNYCLLSLFVLDIFAADYCLDFIEMAFIKWLNNIML